MLNCAHAWRDTTKAKCWEPLVKVIRLNDLSNRLNSLNVLVVVALVVEGAWALWVSIGSCEVNCDGKGYLPSSHQVVYKAWNLLKLERIESKCTWTSCELECILSSFLELIRSSDDVTRFKSISHEKSELDPCHGVTICKLSKPHLVHGPSWALSVPQVGTFEDGNESTRVSTSHLSHDLIADSSLLSTHSHASTMSVVDISSTQLEENSVISIVDGLCSDDDLTTITCLLVILKFLL